MLKRYPTDLTGEQWALIEPPLPPALPDGQPRTVDLRAALGKLDLPAPAAAGGGVRRQQDEASWPSPVWASTHNSSRPT